MKLSGKEYTRIDVEKYDLSIDEKINASVALQKEKLRKVLISENSKLQHTYTKEQDSVRELEDTINRYETGLIKLPKKVVESFEIKGISYEYALNCLRNYKGSKKEKEALVKNNPFFTYGILLSSKDINLLKCESIDVYTSIPIPILNKSDLNKALKMDSKEMTSSRLLAPLG